MTVREWINKKKYDLTVQEVIDNLDSLRIYAFESGYDGKKLDEEYDGNYRDEEDDPWISDIACCEKAIELILSMVQHIYNFEEDMAKEVLENNIGLKGIDKIDDIKITQL